MTCMTKFIYSRKSTHTLILKGKQLYSSQLQFKSLKITNDLIA